LWISPPVPEQSGVGLGPEAASHWQRVWSIADYEPDPVVALVLGGGASAYFDGWLYWGTMVVPALAPALYAIKPDGPLGEDPEGGDVVELFLRSWRALTLFRGRQLETDEPEIELLYGLADALVGSETASALRSFLAGGAAPSDKPSALLSWARGHGADLWRFDSSQAAAVPEDVRGLGNRFNYGLRSLVAKPHELVIGTANPMNLETGGLRHGGWELVELVPR
jgi:hypothetical protein